VVRFYLKSQFSKSFKTPVSKEKISFSSTKKDKNNRTHKLMHCPFKIFQNWHLIRMYTCNEYFPQLFFLETSSHHVSDGSGPKSAQNYRSGSLPQKRMLNAPQLFIGLKK
jgi:hypothetical protein